jgi:2-polyprenyl-6-methoxyphenol hydroxylase-like FAD-dependent oxidoreductase
MPAVDSVLIVGAGVSGCAAAILLAEAGVQVELIDQNAEIGSRGSGITLQGNALRVLRQLGVWDTLLEQGFAFNTVGFRAPDPQGTLIVEVPDARTGGPDLPATLGMPRPALASVLIDRARQVGVTVRLGQKYVGHTQDASTVTATLEDESGNRSSADYDLVIGADGVRSRVRADIGLEATITPIGMGIWRMFLPRPESIARTDLVYGGASYIAGYCPTSDDSIYAYLVQKADPADAALSHEEGVERFRSLSEAYHGPWDDIRPSISHDRFVNYAVFESHVVEGPWNVGRIVIIGDAAHSCPPTLAQGAAQALEDAAVLSEILIAGDEVTDATFTSYLERRRPRASAVVSASVQLCDWLISGARDADVPGLMGRISHLVGEPA